MPSKRKSKTSASKKSKPKRTATATKRGKKRGSRATTQVRQTAMKVLAGAAAGAVRAIIQPLEKAAGSQGSASKERKS